LQKPGIDYEEICFPIVNAITFRFLINLIVTESLDMRLMDAVTTYLYELLDNDIYMKILERCKMPEAYNFKFQSIYSIKL
jgi:hypothetical protein